MNIKDISSEFDNSNWEIKPISSIMKIKDIKQVPSTDAPLMSFVANKGVVPKGNKYDRSHLVKSKDKKYKRTDMNDFIYSSNNLDVGSIGLNTYGSAVISVVYEIFEIFPDYNPVFVSELIQRPKVLKDIIKYRQGCLYGQYKIYPEDFLSVRVKTPSKETQDKVAELLKLYNRKIDLSEEKIDMLEELKKNLLNRIFKQELRFDPDSNEKYSEWSETMLSDILTERKQKSTGNENVYSVSVTKGLVDQIEHLGRSFAAYDTSKYKLVKPGDVIYTKSPTGEFKWGIVKQSTIDKDVIISPLYGVFIPENEDIGYILDAYFSSNIRAHNYLITQIRKGAKNTINISNDEFLAKEIILPTDRKEQKKLADFIRTLNRKIDLEKSKYEEYKNKKEGILQTIFD